jgi:uncharacterized protein (TIGR00730 family)
VEIIIKKICVFCGSSPGANPAFTKAAAQLGKEIASRQMELIYGGSTLGLMGEVARTALNGGARVTAVMPKVFEDKVQHPKFVKLHITDTMHQRKNMMFELADSFIALPGGMGTFEEILEMVTWAQIGYHTKPCGILNICGYYDKLFTFLDNAVKERFIRPEHRDMLMWDVTPENLFEQFSKYKAPKIDKWLDR